MQAFLEIIKEAIKSISFLIRIAFITAGVSLVLLILPDSFYTEIGVKGYLENYKPYVWLIFIVSSLVFFFGFIADFRSWIGGASSVISKIQTLILRRKAEHVTLFEKGVRRREGLVVHRGTEWVVLESPRLFCQIHNLELRLTTGLIGTQHSICTLCRDAHINYGVKGITENTDGIYYHHGLGYVAAIDEIKRRLVQIRGENGQAVKA